MPTNVFVCLLRMLTITITPLFYMLRQNESFKNRNEMHLSFTELSKKKQFVNSYTQHGRIPEIKIRGSATLFEEWGLGAALRPPVGPGQSPLNFLNFGDFIGRRTRPPRSHFYYIPQ
jgi:hypothetical protein